VARHSRLRCDSGIYHIVLRGINQQDIFFDIDDYQRFLATLHRMKANMEYELYGYCLMSNHVHLLIKELVDTVSRTISRVGTSYAWWYNGKYQRSGHVFQGRFRSECVEDDQYLLTVIRYIHNNPVKAGITKLPEEYRFSSIHEYYGQKRYNDRLLETGLILELFDREHKKAIEEFKKFMLYDGNDRWLEDDTQFGKTDEEVKSEIERLMENNLIFKLHELDRNMRNEILRKIKASEGVSLRQIARVTGLSLKIVYKA